MSVSSPVCLAQHREGVCARRLCQRGLRRVLPVGRNGRVGLSAACSRHLAMEERFCALTGLGLGVHYTRGAGPMATACVWNTRNFSVYFYMKGHVQNYEVPLIIAKTQLGCSLKMLNQI